MRASARICIMYMCVGVCVRPRNGVQRPCSPFQCRTPVAHTLHPRRRHQQHFSCFLHLQYRNASGAFKPSTTRCEDDVRPSNAHEKPADERRNLLSMCECCRLFFTRCLDHQLAVQPCASHAGLWRKKRPVTEHWLKLTTDVRRYEIWLVCRTSSIPIERRTQMCVRHAAAAAAPSFPSLRRR